MRVFKKAAVFILLNVVLGLLLNFLLICPDEFSCRFRDCRDGEYQTAVVGHSLGERGIDPNILSTGEEKAFNLCQGGLAFHDLYFVIEELNEKSPLDRVYLDLSYDYWTEEAYDMDYATFCYKTAKNLSFGNRLEYFTDNFPSLNYNKYFSDYQLTAFPVREIPRNVRMKLSEAYRNGDADVIMNQLLDTDTKKYMGQGFSGCIKREDSPYAFHDFDREEIDRRAVRDFDRIVEYCKENEIELICVISALPPARLQNENHGEKHDFYEELCSARDVPLYDMNYLKFDLLPREKEDYADANGHMMLQLAQRQTELLKEITAADDKSGYFEDSYDDVLQDIAEYQETEK